MWLAGGVSGRMQTVMSNLDPKQTSATDPGFTIEPVRASSPSQITGLEFCEVPDLDTMFRIKRTKAFEGIKEGYFKSVLLRRPGGKSGKRLVHVESVRRWLMSQMESGKN